MIKYLTTALAVCSLCACAHTASPVASPVTVVAAPVSVEVAEKQVVTAIPCTDDLDCMKKVTGFCANGYMGTRSLQAENGRRVGILLHCTTDEEVTARKAEEARQEAEEAAYQKMVAARRAAAEAEAAKKAQKK